MTDKQKRKLAIKVQNSVEKAQSLAFSLQEIHPCEAIDEALVLLELALNELDRPIDDLTPISP